MATDETKPEGRPKSEEVPEPASEPHSTPVGKRPRWRRVLFSRRLRLARWLAVVAVLLLALHIWVEISTDHEIVLKRTSVISHGDSRTLVVLVDGYGAAPDHLADLHEVIRAELPDADILAPTYDPALLANIRPLEVADHLRLLIDARFTERREQGNEYQRVILIGFSAGALITRKAYIDRVEQAAKAGEEDGWCHRVDRIILMAGMNRGWSLSPKPRNLHLSKKLLCKFGLWVGRLSGTGRFIRDLQRGSPFVGDLRLQWIRAARDETTPIAPVFQMLGYTDNLVTRDDNMDLDCAESFTFIEVPGRHQTVVKFPDTNEGRTRERVFTRLITDTDTDALRNDLGRMDYVREVEARKTDVDHIVFIMHGIRDDAEWIGSLRSQILDLAEQRRAAGESDEIVRVVTSEYGYFPMGSFLISPWRGVKVRWFVDLYTEELARCRGGDVKVSFIGHSNGTYLLAKAMLLHEHMRFENVVFAGSVISQNYPWDRFVRDDGRGRIRKFRNDRGMSDWVVAIFPHFFEQLARATGAEDGWLAELGSGGFNGFVNDAGHSNEVILVGSHGAGLNKANFSSLAQFLLTGESQPVDELVVKSNRTSSTVSFLSHIAWLIWLLLFAGISGIGGLITKILNSIRRLRFPTWVSWTGYILLIILLLQSV